MTNWKIRYLLAALTMPLACVAVAGQVDWTASRAEGVGPTDGLRWIWPEVGPRSRAP